MSTMTYFVVTAAILLLTAFCAGHIKSKRHVSDIVFAGCIVALAWPVALLLGGVILPFILFYYLGKYSR